MSQPAADRPRPEHPHTLAGWARLLQPTELPVLARTAAAVEDLRPLEDTVDARLLAEAISPDPLMTLKLLARAAELHRQRRTTDAETVREALVLMGITPFFAQFGPQPTVEAHLAQDAEALAGLMAVIRRAERAGRFALAFAVHRQDPDAEILHEAALLHDFSDMLLWLHAPDLALDMQQRQQDDPTLRSATVQRQLLGVTLGELQHALMQAWHLPALLVTITDDSHALNAQVRNVLLATRLARHTQRGWDNAAVPDDVRDIAALLNMGLVPTEALLRDLDS